MALDPNTYGQVAESALEDQIERLERLPPAEMAEEFALVYHDYAREGECGGVDIGAGGDPGALTPGFISDNTPETVTRLANALCDYWETFTTPGVAEVLNTVVSVTPDASAQRGPMEQAIRDYAQSGSARDGWRGWYEATEAVVNQIPFTVVEMDGDGNTQTFVRLVL